MSESPERQAPKGFSPTGLRVSLILVAIAYTGCLVLLTHASLTEDTGSAARWGVQCIPLLVVLPWLLLRHHRAYSWLCFIILMYFIPSVAKVMDPRGDWSHTLLLCFTIIIFFASALASRWLQRAPGRT